MKKIAGYTDKISVAPGDCLSFMVSCEDGTSAYRVQLVRLICTDDHPDGPGLVERPIDSPINRSYPGRQQSIHTGSCVVVPPSSKLASMKGFTLQAMVWPTTPGRGQQTIMGTWSAGSSKGFALELDEQGALALRLDSQCFSTGQPLLAREWYLAAASYDRRTGEVRLPKLNGR
jgi:N,N-dimethylformamidase